MAPLQSSALAKNAANLAAQLALVESRGREESMGREKTDSRHSTGTVVSAAGDSMKDSMASSVATSQPTSGHTSPLKLENSVGTSRATSRATTGHTSPAKLEDSTSTSWAASQITTGRTSPTKLKDTEEAQTFAKELEDPPSMPEGNGNPVHLISGQAGEENFQKGTRNEMEVLSYSVAEAVEAFETKTTRTKKSKKSKINNQTRPNSIHMEKRDRIEITQTSEVRTFGWKRISLLGLILLGFGALLFTYRNISEFSVVIKFKHLEN